MGEVTLGRVNPRMLSVADGIMKMIRHDALAGLRAHTQPLRLLLGSPSLRRDSGRC